MVEYAIFFIVRIIISCRIGLGPLCQLYETVDYHKFAIEPILEKHASCFARSSDRCVYY